MEEWRPIPGHMGMYEISSSGKVRNTKTKMELVQSFCKSGYLKVKLCYGKQKTITIHKLVATAFCERKSDAVQVNHIDGNKLNNNSENLEWVTPKENTAHAIKHGLFVFNLQTGRLPDNRRAVIGTFPDGRLVRFNSAAEAGRAFSVSRHTISSVCMGRAKTSRGLMWMYA